MRDLPDLVRFAEDVKQELGAAAVHVLEPNWTPALALSFTDGRRAVLLRDYGMGLTLCHADVAEDFSTRAEWKARSQLLFKRCDGVFVLDVVLALMPMLARLSGEAVDLSLGHTRAPQSVAVTSSRTRRLVVEQAKRRVRIDCILNSGKSSRTIASLDEVAALEAWLQTEAIVSKGPPSTNPPITWPTLEGVLAALRGGARFTVGGGRSSQTWCLQNGEVICEVFDEGSTWIQRYDEAVLLRDVRSSPGTFRQSTLAMP